MPKYLYIDPFSCTGCSICELVCSFIKEGVNNPSLARIRTVRKESGEDKIISCKHCKKPKCMEACPNDAIEITDEGQVEIIEELCDGCRKCLEACPFGAMVYIPARNVVAKCDLCGECIKFCPTGELVIKGGA